MDAAHSAGTGRVRRRQRRRRLCAFSNKQTRAATRSTKPSDKGSNTLPTRLFIAHTHCDGDGKSQTNKYEKERERVAKIFWRCLIREEHLLEETNGGFEHHLPQTWWASFLFGRFVIVLLLWHVYSFSLWPMFQPYSHFFPFFFFFVLQNQHLFHSMNWTAVYPWAFLWSFSMGREFSKKPGRSHSSTTNTRSVQANYDDLMMTKMDPVWLWLLFNNFQDRSTDIQIIILEL